MATARSGHASTADSHAHAKPWAWHPVLLAIASGVVQTNEDLRDQSGPTRLMAGAAAAAGVAVEIFVEGNIVFPIRIVVEQLRITEHGPFSVCIAGENARDAMSNFAGHLLERFHLA